MKTIQNKQTLLVGLSTLGLSTMMLSASVAITSFTQNLSVSVNDTTTIAPGINLTASNNGINLSDTVLDEVQGVASASSSIEYESTVGFPTTLNTATSGFDLQFEAGVITQVAQGTAGSTAEATVNFTFTVEVLDGEADFIFSNTGSDSDIRYFVNGVIATNEAQTQRLGVGSYTVTLIDGAATSTEAINSAPSSQTNVQNYNLQVVEVIPEPSSTALLGLAGFGFLVRRRR